MNRYTSVLADGRQPSAVGSAGGNPVPAPTSTVKPLHTQGDHAMIEPSHWPRTEKTSGHAATTMTRVVLEPFEYEGVRLLPSRFQEQAAQARDVYYGVPNDDILKGFRRDAGLPAPGHDMGGWCSRTSGVIFGQLLSGMARMSKATSDADLRAKAITLLEGWRETVGPDGDLKLGAYPWEKLVCGLVDLYVYAGYEPALPLLERTTDWAARAFDRSRPRATALDWDGRHPGGAAEWYTLPENLYRAYLISGNSLFKDFADIWLYEDFWRQFEHTSAPKDAHSVHAYSHVNSFSSAAMAYAVTGDQRYLTIATNAYDYLQRTQCYATGGYGPAERLLPTDGRLGRALELHADDAEIPCGTWAGFKLARYLMTFTGEARYGDWIERLLYNGIGAALPTQSSGQTFYYADYRVASGEKLYFWEAWPCCSGTYWQAVADYHNMIYFKDSRGLFVNLFVPSEVIWSCGDETVVVRQDTAYPESDTTSLQVTTERPLRFGLHVRVPLWSKGVSVELNGSPVDASTIPGAWASIERAWYPGDRVTIRMPMEVRLVPVDAQHPKRAAVMYGPVVLVQDGRFKRPFRLGADVDMADRLVPDGPGLRFKAVDHEPQDIPTGAFQPFYAAPERLPYRMYVDLDAPKLY